jgi:hypothetical protein
MVRVEPAPSYAQEDTTASARAYLMQARDQLPQSLSVETVVLQGNPAESLEELVVRERIGLMLMTTRQRALRTAEDGLPEVSTYTIWCVLHEADLSWQRDRSWCHTGLARRRRKHGEVAVHDPDATVKRG